MLKAILSGVYGSMGRVVLAEINERRGCEVVAGLDRVSGEELGFPVFHSAAELLESSVPADVIIDFSHPGALEPLLELAVIKKLPAVIATTGYNGKQIDAIKRAAERIPVFFTFNMSLGINLTVELAKSAARVLGGEFDVEIIERHHAKKIDAPSGTALMLAEGISSVLEEEPQYIYDRHSRRGARAKNEIGIHSIRGGSIVGEHEVVFAGKDEIVAISHSAHSRRVFATGAVNAALFLTKQPPGLYNMAHLLAGK